MKHNLARSITLVFILLIMGITMINVQAEEATPKTIRVAFPYQENLTEVDGFGNYSGYSYEYLKKIAQYTGWQYEFITMDSRLDEDEALNQAMTMVKNGEADILGAMLASPALGESYTYCTQEYGNVYTTLSTLEENTAITATNYSTISPLRVAVLKTATTRNEELEQYAQSNGITYQRVECDTVEEQVQAIRDNRADTLLRVSVAPLKGTREVTYFSPRPFYFITTKGNTEIANAMDRAIIKINAANPYYQENLNTQYFGNTSGGFYLSDRETAYLKNFGPLKALMVPDFAPFVFKDTNGNTLGIAPSILSDFCSRVGLTMNYDVYDGKTTLKEAIAAGDYDCVLGVSASANFASENGLLLSDPFQEIALTRFDNRTTQKEQSEKTLALVEGYDILANLEYKDVKYYKNVESCMEAVNHGVADFGYANAYSVDYYSGENAFNNLEEYAITGSSRSMCFGMTDNQDITLVTILNRYIRNLSDSQLNTYYSNAIGVNESGIVVHLIKTNPALGTTLILILVLAVCTIVLQHHNNLEKQRQNEALIQANAAKSEFLSRMSHEIRTPINVVLGMSDAMMMEPENPQAMEEAMAEINTSSRFLLGLVNDILDMTKIENAKMVLKPEAVEMEGFFKGIETIIQPQMEKKGLAFIFSQGGEHLPYALFDRLRLQQIYINLLTNACKYTPQGGEVICTTQVEAPASGDYTAVVVVKDNGVGMSETFLGHLFEPFEQEQCGMAASTNGGTGLGLTIVKSIVTLMGGTIAVKSALGEGSVFSLCIPLKAASPADIARLEEKLVVDPTAHYLEGHHILLAEDHPLNAKITVKILEKKGMTVEVVPDGKQAVMAFETSAPHTYSAIIMDIRMPEMDGLTATRTIRALPRADAATIPIIAMSANAFDDDVAQSKAAGMNTHLAKPVVPKVLYQALEGYIKEAEADRRGENQGKI